MDFNQLIYSRLAANATLVAILAKFDNQPAIFNTEFPIDQQPGWGGKVEYPRIDFKVDMMADPQRASSGLLRCLIYTEKNPLIAEQIEAQVRGSLGDVLMKPSDKAPLCVAWSRTDAYQYEGSAVLVKEVDFDILEYPDQVTTDPDPILAISNYIKSLFGDSSIVLGIDSVGDFTNTAETPVWYCRLGTIQQAPDQHGMLGGSFTWFVCSISIHLICPDASMRLKMVAGLNQELSCEGEVIMDDDSPMDIQRAVMSNQADYLRSGQITLNCQFGCIKKIYKIHRLNHVEIEGDFHS